MGWNKKRNRYTRFNSPIILRVCPTLQNIDSDYKKYGVIVISDFGKITKYTNKPFPFFDEVKCYTVNNDTYAKLLCELYYEIDYTGLEIPF